MQSKKLEIAIFLACFLLLRCSEESRLDFEPSMTTFVLLDREDGREFFTIYYSLKEITPSTILDLGVGEEERLAILKKERKITLVEYKKLEKRNEVFLVDEAKKIDLFNYIRANIGISNSFFFDTIPKDQIGMAMKILDTHGYYVSFSDYQGEYYIRCKGTNESVNIP